MTAAEKLEQIKRERTPHSTEELVRLGEARYKEIRSELEAHHHGDFIMIEVDTGDYFIGSTPQAALDGAQSAHPDKVFYLMRIGYKATHKLKHRFKLFHYGVPWPILHSNDELEAGPHFVYGTNLHINESGVQTYLSDGVVRQISHHS